jgi:serine/threonine protein phosphatase PrpC
MVLTYGFSLMGTSHKSNGTKCQDANGVGYVKDIVVAAVADGVGSCKHSDIASRIAVDVSIAYCEKGLKAKPDGFDLETMVEGAFGCAELAIEKQSLKDKKPLSEYDTTLDLVIYDGKRLTFGHCGDGGIVGLTVKGDYVRVTTPQKKEGMFVVPLRDGSKEKNDTWVFGSVEDELASVLLATDGVYDTFFPYLLKGQPIEVYVPLIMQFMDNNLLKASKKTIKNIGKEIEGYFNSASCASITDDKTLLVLINGDITPERKEESFYSPPDWDNLLLEWNKKAYPHLPHLYEKKEVTNVEEETGTSKSSCMEEDEVEE